MIFIWRDMTVTRRCLNWNESVDWEAQDMGSYAWHLAETGGTSPRVIWREQWEGWQRHQLFRSVSPLRTITVIWVSYQPSNHLLQISRKIWSLTKHLKVRFKCLALSIFLKNKKIPLCIHCVIVCKVVPQFLLCDNKHLNFMTF